MADQNADVESLTKGTIAFRPVRVETHNDRLRYIAEHWDFWGPGIFWPLPCYHPLQPDKYNMVIFIADLSRLFMSMNVPLWRLWDFGDRIYGLLANAMECLGTSEGVGRLEPPHILMALDQARELRSLRDFGFQPVPRKVTFDRESGQIVPLPEDESQDAIDTTMTCDVLNHDGTTQETPAQDTGDNHEEETLRHIQQSRTTSAPSTNFVVEIPAYQPVNENVLTESNPTNPDGVPGVDGGGTGTIYRPDPGYPSDEERFPTPFRPRDYRPTLHKTHRQEEEDRGACPDQNLINAQLYPSNRTYDHNIPRFMPSDVDIPEPEGFPDDPWAAATFAEECLAAADDVLAENAPSDPRPILTPPLSSHSPTADTQGRPQQEDIKLRFGTSQEQKTEPRGTSPDPTNGSGSQATPSQPKSTRKAKKKAFQAKAESSRKPAEPKSAKKRKAAAAVAAKNKQDRESSTTEQAWPHTEDNIEDAYSVPPSPPATNKKRKAAIKTAPPRAKRARRHTMSCVRPSVEEVIDLVESDIAPGTRLNESSTTTPNEEPEPSTQKRQRQTRQQDPRKAAERLAKELKMNIPILNAERDEMFLKLQELLELSGANSGGS